MGDMSLVGLALLLALVADVALVAVGKLERNAGILIGVIILVLMLASFKIIT